MNEPDYILDISSSDACDTPAEAEAAAVRPWIGVQFDCCGVYVRIYRNREGTAYVGCCPRCLARAEIRVGTGGTASRIFRAS